MNNEFRVSDVSPGSVLLVGDVAVFNVNGHLCATQAKCPHQRGPLDRGTLEGSTLTCPWHGSQFDVCTGAVLQGPATGSLMTYAIVVEGDLARIVRRQSPAVPPAVAIHGANDAG
jgi:nitrite reductase/ring-hydroxylating ferredoxin subunit